MAEHLKCNQGVGVRVLQLAPKNILAMKKNDSTFLAKMADLVSMKILVSHNVYQQAGGEDAVVNAEIDLLRSFGNEVVVYRRNNNEIGKQSSFSTASSAIWSRQSVADLRVLCDQFHPDIIHSHNTFPLISPSLYWFASDQKIPVVQTLHNFRLLCPQAMFLRNGKICEDCVGKVPWRAVARSCYHTSALQSAVVANMLIFHRAVGTYNDRVRAYIAMNDFCKEKFVAGGIPESRIHIKSNFVRASQLPDWSSRRGGLFVGRLSEEKGISILIDAVEKIRNEQVEHEVALSMKVVGSGPMSPEVTHAFKDDYLAAKNSEEIFSLLQSAQFLIAPSTCYESCPLVAAEAFSSGVPVIGSRHGGIAAMVKDGVNGLLFNPGDADDLAKKISWALKNPTRMLEMGKAAYQEYLEKYTPERNYKILMDIYLNALSTDGIYDEN
jgi:glycosyltransferase involved in cell wall biosynthesis